MASSDEIAEVRENTSEPTEDNWTDLEVGAFIDLYGVNGSSAHIWRKKAAMYADLVNVSEAGSSHSLGDLQEKALRMAALFEEESYEDTGGRVKIHVIDR